MNWVQRFIAAIATHKADVSAHHDPSLRATGSTANKTIHVDKEATGSGDGTSWADAFTTIMAAVDSIEDLILHVYTLIIRHGTKKTGTADANVLNKLHDTGEFPVATTWVGRRVFNIGGTGPGDNWGVVSARDSDDQLSIVDQVTGAVLDLFPNGNEDYVIEPTPYRETVYLNSTPATHPAHNILGSLEIKAEHYWYGDCDAQVNVGEILDAAADFSNVEVGDRVYVIDLNGAGSKAQDYEIGTVDDISQIGANIVRTTLTKTPTTNWKYAIVKTEISGSDDGTDGGTARGKIIDLLSINYVDIDGFYYTFSDDAWATVSNSKSIYLYCGIIENCDNGINPTYYSNIRMYYFYSHCGVNDILVYTKSIIDTRYSVLRSATRGIRHWDGGQSGLTQCVIDQATTGVHLERFCNSMVYKCTITANVATGIYARGNSYALQNTTDNLAIAPVDPVGTLEGAYIE